MDSSTRIRRRLGVVLISVLYVIVAVSALLAVIQWQVRDRVHLVTNMEQRLRAEWLAEGCVAALHWSMSNALSDSTNGVASSAAWRRLDERTRTSPFTVRACSWRLTPAGLRLSVNDMDEATLVRTLSMLSSTRVDVRSAAAAILDWIDADNVARPGGAEATWYVTARRPAPANRPLESPHELLLIRGMEEADNAPEVLGVDVEPLDAFHARPEVLRLLPGMSDELVARIVDVRDKRGSLPEIEELAQGLSFGARQSLDANFVSLKARYSPEPFAWVLEVAASSRKGTGVRIRQRLTRSGVRVVIQQEWREWL